MAEQTTAQCEGVAMLAPTNLPGGVQVRYWAFDDDGPAELPVALETPGSHTDLNCEDAARIGRALLAAAAVRPAPDARERLARHLFLDRARGDWRATAAAGWDSGDDRINKHTWRAKADTMLAVITGQDQP